MADDTLQPPQATDRNDDGWDDFLTWHRHGMDRRWCGPAVCVTHDGVPTSEAEEDEWEQGDDPCTHMIRLYDSPETADAVEKNHAPSVWRKPL